MANRIRPLDEKVQSVRVALRQIQVEKVARLAGVPASTLRYDLQKLDTALPQVLANQTPGPTRVLSKSNVKLTFARLGCYPSESPSSILSHGNQPREESARWTSPSIPPLLPP
jgi:hypothetical protein